MQVNSIDIEDTLEHLFHTPWIFLLQNNCSSCCLPTLYNFLSKSHASRPNFNFTYSKIMRKISIISLDSPLAIHLHQCAHLLCSSFVFYNLLSYYVENISYCAFPTVLIVIFYTLRVIISMLNWIDCNEWKRGENQDIFDLYHQFFSGWLSMLIPGWVTPGRKPFPVFGWTS